MSCNDCHMMLPAIHQDGFEKLLRLPLGAKGGRVAHKAIDRFIEHSALDDEQTVASWSHSQACQRCLTRMDGEVAGNADTTIAVNGQQRLLALARETGGRVAAVPE